MGKAKVVNKSNKAAATNKKEGATVVDISKIAAERAADSGEPKMGARKLTIKLCGLAHQRAVKVAQRLAGTALHKQALEIARMSAELAERAEDLGDDYRAPARTFAAGDVVRIPEALIERYSELFDAGSELKVVRVLERRTIIEDKDGVRAVLASSHLRAV